MKLSNQTVLLIFGVTLVHLVAIAALTPTTQPSRISQPTLFPDEPFVGPIDDSALVPAVEESTVEARPLPATEPSEPVDLPARFRELPGASPAAAPDPVAETRPAPDQGRMPRELAPLPRS